MNLHLLKQNINLFTIRLKYSNYGSPHKIIYVLCDKFQNVIFEYVYSQILKKQIEEVFIPENYTFFLKKQDIKNWGKQHSDHFEKRLEKQQIFPFYENKDRELDEISYYTRGYSHIKLNNYLRGQPVFTNENYMQKKIELIESCLSKFYINENIVAIRRIEAKYTRKYKKGNKIKFPEFLSTTINLSNRKRNESKNELFNKEALILLKIPSGSNCAYVETVSQLEEYELLFQRGTTILIERNITVFQNRIIIGSILNK
jgi:hypothetical protein